MAPKPSDQPVQTQSHRRIPCLQQSPAPPPCACAISTVGAYFPSNSLYSTDRKYTSYLRCACTPTCPACNNITEYWCWATVRVRAAIIILCCNSIHQKRKENYINQVNANNIGCFKQLGWAKWNCNLEYAANIFKGKNPSKKPRWGKIWGEKTNWKASQVLYLGRCYASIN